MDEGIRRRLARTGGRAVSLHDPSYPPGLRRLSAPPSVVFLSGAWNHPGPSVALVGARDASDDGIDIARNLAAALAAQGVAIVSGLARGIDAAAHRGAMDAGGSSGAVLGTSLDRCYPAEHRALQREVAASLGLLTEQPPGSPATPGRFASRNRLLAAIADAVVVVQGRDRSGALITAHVARQLGRPLGAMPWDSRDPLGSAPHGLIRGGATLVRHAGDVLELIGLSSERSNPAPPGPRPAPPSGLGDREQRLLQALRERPRPLETAAQDAALTIAEAGAALVVLEILGHAQRIPGGAVRRVGRF